MFAVVNAKSKSYVRHVDELYRGYPFGLCWLSDIFGKRFIYFVLFELFLFWASAIWCGVYRSCVKAQKFDEVFHNFEAS